MEVFVLTTMGAMGQGVQGGSENVFIYKNTFNTCRKKTTCRHHLSIRLYYYYY